MIESNCAILIRITPKMITKLNKPEGDNTMNKIWGKLRFASKIAVGLLMVVFLVLNGYFEVSKVNAAEVEHNFAVFFVNGIDNKDIGNIDAIRKLEATKSKNRGESA